MAASCGDSASLIPAFLCFQLPLPLGKSSHQASPAVQAEVATLLPETF